MAMGKDVWTAMVAVADEACPAWTDFPDLLRDRWPDAPPLAEFSQKGNVATFRLGEATGAITYLPRPIPLAHLEGPCQCAWYWPQATEEMARHRGHLLVTLLDEGRDSLVKAMGLTHLVAATLGATQPIGVVWCPAGLVHAPAPFLELSQSIVRESLPLFLWVDFRVELTPSGELRLFTTGLAPLDVREVEVPRFRGDPRALREAAYNVAHYAIDRVKTLSDGDTLGVAGKAELTIRLGPSMLDGDTPVYSLEFTEET